MMCGAHKNSCFPLSCWLECPEKKKKLFVDRRILEGEPDLGFPNHLSVNGKKCQIFCICLILAENARISTNWTLWSMLVF